MKSLTVVMINYNNEKYLRQAIDSVLSQSILPDEFIISDDGSTDSSLAIIEEYAAKCEFIRFVRTPENLGAAGNRDFAIRHSTSINIQTIDSDDWLEPGCIERVIDSLAKSPYGIIISSFRVVDASGLELERIDTLPFCQADQFQKTFLLSSRHRCMPGNQFAMSLETYLRLGGLNKSLKLYEDWDLLLRSCQCEINFHHSGIVGFSYRKTGQGLSAAKQRKHMLFRLKVVIGNLRTNRHIFSYLKGLVYLFVSKGWKQLIGSASPVGYN